MPGTSKGMHIQTIISLAAERQANRGLDLNHWKVVLARLPERTVFRACLRRCRSLDIGGFYGNFLVAKDNVDPKHRLARLGLQSRVFGWRAVLVWPWTGGAVYGLGWLMAGTL